MSHVVIVGAGLIGLLSARALRARGLEVTVVERGEVGHEASRAGGGILSPLHPWRFPDAVTALSLRGQALWPSLAETLRDASGVDPELRPGGMLVFDSDDPREMTAWAERHGVALKPLSPRELGEHEPALRPPAKGAPWLLPQVASVRPPRLLRAVRRAAEREGVAVRAHAPVRALAVADGRAVGVDTAAGRVEADAVVVCAGAWTAALVTGLGRQPPGIRPVRGQMLALGAEPGVLRHIVLAEDRYLVPRRDGVVLAGSSLEDVGFDAGTTDDARRALTRFAAALVPSLAGAPLLSHWAGLRPGSDDGVPTIAAHPAVADLWVNAGHHRNGIVTAPASAELLAARMAGEAPPLDPAPYAWPPDDAIARGSEPG